MPRLRPLVVAGVAAVLLVVVLGTDVYFTRTYALDARASGGEWVQVGSTSGDERYSRPYEGPVGLRVPANGTVEFRLRADNPYPWAHSAPWTFRAGGVTLQEGTLVVPAGGSEAATFSLDASALRDARGAVPPEPVGKIPAYVDIWVTVAGNEIYASLVLQEAGA